MQKVTNLSIVYPPVTVIQAETRHSIELMRSPRFPVEDHALTFATRQSIHQYFVCRLQLPSKYVPYKLYCAETESRFLTEDHTPPVGHTPAYLRSTKIKSTLPVM
ncbi:hypothetical protein TNCV_1339971 [Trichonephila clavipes]|uniref:Uncharacterized protein n=1 Tax=Trichonephila clavipes TaxID=2585209 RepID=A0A8X6UZI1_TRICX|nr:hypothetical protein TNCV_1339971 [Trichonephila clavipes]